MFIWKKKRIMNLAKKSGCDVDGDIVYYHGISYVVDIQHNIIKRNLYQPIKEFYKNHFIKRFSFNGRILIKYIKN